MTIRVLRSVAVPATTQPDLWIDDSAGYRQVIDRTKAVVVADDGPAQHAFVSRCLTQLGRLSGRSVAWIGGGLGIGPAIFDTLSCVQTIYDLEPLFAEFCPASATFVVGDWHDTLTGKYDVIVYDLGGEVPIGKLSVHLNRGGIILPQ